MKFEKFVKSLGTNGVIYKRENGERWLASSSVFMLVPDNIRGVTASDILDMPQKIDEIISAISSEPCELDRAIMPYGDSGIKDCVRVFSNLAGDINIPISNPDFALIEKADIKEIQYRYIGDDAEPIALMVKAWPVIPADEPELVGVIFPTDYDL